LSSLGVFAITSLKISRKIGAATSPPECPSSTNTTAAYCHMLDEAIQELKTGKTVEVPVEPVLEFQVEAYISGDYIGDAMHKIEIYQRIAASRSDEHLNELLDELIDRFGEPPECVMNLLTIARMKNKARQLGIRAIIQRPHYIDMTFSEKPNVEIERILALKESLPGRVTMFPGPPGSIQVKTAKLSDKSLCPWLLKKLELLENPAVISSTDRFLPA
jgi:transcription-repair coupling factor (superfamily II helicase)